MFIKQQKIIFSRNIIVSSIFFVFVCLSAWLCNSGFFFNSTIISCNIIVCVLLKQSTCSKKMIINIAFTRLNSRNRVCFKKFSSKNNHQVLFSLHGNWNNHIKEVWIVKVWVIKEIFDKHRIFNELQNYELKFKEVFSIFKAWTLHSELSNLFQTPWCNNNCYVAYMKK